MEKGVSAHLQVKVTEKKYKPNVVHSRLDAK